MDRWSVHRAAARRLVETGSRWLAVEWLPAYAPELNPTEQVWNHTKYGDLANYLPADIDALCREVERSIGAKKSSHALLRSFFNHADLSL
jgi:transposase